MDRMNCRLDGTGVGQNQTGTLSNLHQIVSFIWAYHLKHNAPLNYDFYSFCHRVRIPPPHELTQAFEGRQYPTSTAENTASPAEQSATLVSAQQTTLMQEDGKTQIGKDAPSKAKYFNVAWHKTSLDGFLQDVELQPTMALNDLSHYLEITLEYLQPELQRNLDKGGAFSFWVSVQVRYSHPIKSLKDMNPPFLHTGKQLVLRRSQIR